MPATKKKTMKPNEDKNKSLKLFHDTFLTYEDIHQMELLNYELYLTKAFYDTKPGFIIDDVYIAKAGEYGPIFFFDTVIKEEIDLDKLTLTSPPPYNLFYIKTDYIKTLSAQERDHFYIIQAFIYVIGFHYDILAFDITIDDVVYLVFSMKSREHNLPPFGSTFHFFKHSPPSKIIPFLVLEFSKFYYPDGEEGESTYVNENAPLKYKVKFNENSNDFKDHELELLF